MKEYTILLPYEDADTQTTVWANMESTIDFQTDIHNAAKCTVAFAALELKNFLSKTVTDTELPFSYIKPENGFVIALRIGDEASEDNGYILRPINNGVEIFGYGRAGVLYGSYQFLKMQGWRWYAPGDAGEIAVPVRDELILPEEEIKYAPDMQEGRGFDFEGGLKDSEDLWLWMARNRLNLSTYRPLTAQFQKKLCMIFKIGGHIFENILAPDRVLPNGKTFWEEHSEWYGLPADGNRIKEKAQSVQFCVSNKDLCNYLGEELVVKLSNEWSHADRIDVWGFDTWGNSCSCAKCKELGNGSDRTVHFLSEIRAYIDNAVKEKRLKHNVRLVMCAYDGTRTIEAPQNRIPQNLIDARDMVTFYPITRCYAHDFSDESCPENLRFNESLKSWLEKVPAMPVIIGEYYNVSKFEDLPLLFTQRMSNDIPYYKHIGVEAITYMHLPMLNWAMRELNHLIYAELSWDSSADIQSIIDEYFINCLPDAFISSKHLRHLLLLV